MRRLTLLGLLVAFVATSSAYLEAAPKKKCTKEASCTKPCYSWDYPPGSATPDHYCSDIIAHDTPGKTCDTATEGECSDDKQVACGKFGYKTCATTGAPDCTDIDHTDTWYKAGCQ